MSYMSEDRIREEQVRRLTTDENPRGGQPREYVYRVDLKPEKAKTRDREREETARIRQLSYGQASD